MNLRETDKTCRDCYDSEHDNFDSYVHITVVKDPDTNKIVKRSYMCDEHRIMYGGDGYDLYINGRRV